MIYVKVNEKLYPATVNGKIIDREWDDRESKAITIEGTFEQVNAMFRDGVQWSIVDIDIVDDENGNETTAQNEYDNSDFSIRGDLTVHTDGTCTVKMGKPTDLEEAYEMIYGGI